MALILPPIKFEAVPLKDVAEVVFLAETDESPQILCFCRKKFFSHSSYGSDFEISGIPA